MTSAVDIITFIGIPLAVLGVLPILYNTFATLASLSRIQRMLRRSRLTALTRSDVVNRVIEIELPRYAVKALDRFQNQAEYWSLSEHPSSIPGGSWTTFNWKTNTIGLKTQRVEYADQVRQPQVDIAFDELICYLLDLGAVPDPHGWKLLRSTGLWTPVGCSLMMSPDGREKALTVGPQDDADGNLSLVVNWSGGWTMRHHAHLPPYWVRLPARKIVAGESGSRDTAGPEQPEESGKKPVNDNDETLDDRPATRDTTVTQPNIEGDITCQILTAGITSAFSQGDLYSSTSTSSFPIDHLRIQPGVSAGMWFASAATAYGTTGQTVLWNYKIPDDILVFSRKESVPCGVMVLLDMVSDAETPDWCTAKRNNDIHFERTVKRSREQAMAINAESRMAPAQRAAAARDRVQREMNQRMEDMRDDMREDQQIRERRMMEALQSPKWNTQLIAQHSLRWLQTQGMWDEGVAIKDVVGFMLHRMVHDREYASGITKMLHTWKAWADLGGMRQSDFQLVRDDCSTFAHSTLLIAMIMDTCNALEGTLSMDLQECLRLWNKVRLG